MSWTAGRRTASSNSRVCGEPWPGRIIGPDSSQTISPEARKLNMMVVMTMWLPR